VTGRRYQPSRARLTRATRAVGGVRAAARAEQLRACGLDAASIAARLGVSVDALAGYFAVPDELVEAAR
jgi:hypothetical protein